MSYSGTEIIVITFYKTPAKLGFPVLLSTGVTELSWPGVPWPMTRTGWWRAIKMAPKFSDTNGTNLVVEGHKNGTKFHLHTSDKC